MEFGQLAHVRDGQHRVITVPQLGLEKSGDPLGPVQGATAPLNSQATSIHHNLPTLSLKRGAVSYLKGND